MIPKTTLFQLAKALEGLPVLGCLPGRPAARAGVRYGDVLLSLNGVRTRTFTDYIEAKALRTDGMRIVIFRTGIEQTLEFEYDLGRPPTAPEDILEELSTMRLISPDDGEAKGPVS